MAHLTRPVSYVDLISGDVSELLDLGLVAEVGGHVRGFILGRVVPVGEAATKVGEVLILGVHPDYWRKGIATRLVNAIGEKFRSKGIRSARIEIDRRDTEMIHFFERTGFTVGQRIEYSKVL
ncbi:MAG: GNAT family N-acetyltransferase [Chloroflexi bacterium]|nr:GNAT family N-acetyltransferase [Chloroflexota bacterium]